MSYTVIFSPVHTMSMPTSMPTLVDDVTNAYAFRRRQTRPLRDWDIFVSGTQEKLDELRGIIAYAQGDTPFFWDGGGMLEVTDSALIGIGDGATYDYRLPDRHVFVASMILYINGGATAGWQPLGGDGITCDMIRLTSPLGNYAQLKARYRRKAKVVVKTDADIGQDRAFRNRDYPGQTVSALKLTLMEVP